MPLSDLSLVTQALITLIRESFYYSDAWSGDPPAVIPGPPDTSIGDGLVLYMYHITEDPHYKNLSPPGNDTPPVRFVPMALNLFFQLSASSDSTDGSGAYLEQQMMGIAIKALHDYPYIDDTTEIEETTIFPPALIGSENRIKIVLQPVPANEAVNYWTAGTSPLQLSAYYQVSVILLDPEESRSRSGRVLAYGVQTFIEGAPRLENCRNLQSFTIPGEDEPREILLRPAQVPVGDRITFQGTGLAGERITLFLRNNRWNDPVEADAAWEVAPTADEIQVRVQETASTEPVLPGIYSVFARVVRRRFLPSGEIRDFEHDSNECPFMVCPRIDDISPPDLDGIVTVRGYLFRHDDLPIAAVSVYLGESRLEWREPPDPLSPGEFMTADPPSMEILPILLFRLPGGLDSGQVLPVRIFINGAESPPYWIVTP